MPEVQPDPKPELRKGNRPRRIVDHGAVKLAALADRECVACGEQGANGHHVLPKDKGGDDVRENVVVLCGSGTSGCHGAHHGNPYVWRVEPDPRSTTQFAPFMERRDAEWVNRRIGLHLARYRRDTIDYIVRKLGYDEGLHFLRATYHIAPCWIPADG